MHFHRNSDSIYLKVITRLMVQYLLSRFAREAKSMKRLFQSVALFYLECVREDFSKDGFGFKTLRIGKLLLQ